ncbi:hypothetical protein IscW_ISCW022206 [Ixodes scapularis]|uniref:Uncharacterized protein n=1 Tax=Ixodes scapularis TaxID=6945 RepID=B7QE33_IXOSC|nr:hypothetical protein IscW_ISCW022206 [Ixodes scapularis]|eukprot:XP_002413797.1 hypothetical protein IscW_ISCW022206 [Ixodes scapularis]
MKEGEIRALTYAPRWKCAEKYPFGVWHVGGLLSSTEAGQPKRRLPLPRGYLLQVSFYESKEEKVQFLTGTQQLPSCMPQICRHSPHNSYFALKREKATRF